MCVCVTCKFIFNSFFLLNAEPSQLTRMYEDVEIIKIFFFIVIASMVIPMSDLLRHQSLENLLKID